MELPHPRRRRRGRRLLTVLAVAAATLAAATAIVAVRTAALPAPAVVAAAQAAPGHAAPLRLPEHPKVLLFGDSWTYGSAADVVTDGYAYVISRRLGWDGVVDGVRGSGYLRSGFVVPGVDGGTYGSRIARLDPGLRPDLVIVEGSINDRREPAAGYRAAVTAAWDALASRYPEAAIVILGPAPQVLPVEKATARIDRDLAALAAARDWWYVSPIEQRWITPANRPWVIDAANDHPTTRGHAYLATRLAQALSGMTATAVVADAPHDDIAP